MSANFQHPQPANGLQHQHLGSLASKRPSGPTSWILNNRRSAATTSRILGQHNTSNASLENPRPANPSAPTFRILGKQTTAQIQSILVLQTSRLSGSSARLCDPPPANVVERRSPGSCASERFSAPASEILGKQTACSAQDPRPASGLQQQLQDPGPANDLQRQPRRSSASKRRAARTARSLGQQNDIQRQPRGSSASKPFSANPQDPRPANDSANPEDPCPANKH